MIKAEISTDDTADSFLGCWHISSRAAQFSLPSLHIVQKRLRGLAGDVLFSTRNHLTTDETLRASYCPVAIWHMF